MKKGTQVNSCPNYIFMTEFDVLHLIFLQGKTNPHMEQNMTLAGCHCVCFMAYDTLKLNMLVYK